MSATASGEPVVGQLLEGVREADAGRLLVPAEEALHAAQARASLARSAWESSGTIARASSSAPWLSAKWPAAVSAPARASRSSTRSSAGAVCGRRRSASRTSARRSPAPAGRLASPASRRTATAAEVALARRALDVMGARRRRGAPRRERLGAPLVGAQPPAAGRGLVDRAPNERMPEAEAPRHVGGANEIEPQELVDRVHRRRLGRRRPPPPPARARTDRPPPPRPRGRGARRPTAAQLLAQRGGDGGRNADAVSEISNTGGVAVGRGRATGRAARGRTGCRRSPRRAARRRRRPVAEQLPSLVGVSAPSSMRVSRARAVPRSSAADRGARAWRGGARRR